MPRLDSRLRDSAMFHVTPRGFSSHAIEFPVEVPHNRIVRLLWLALLCIGHALRAQVQEEPLFTNHVSVTQPALGSRRQSIGKVAWERVSLQRSVYYAKCGGYLRVCDFRRTRGARSALVSLTYGHMLGHTLGQGHWYRGNFEGDWNCSLGAVLALERLGRRPDSTSALQLCYGTRWIPFVDGGAGVTPPASALPI